MSEMNYRALQDRFGVDEIEWRLQQAGEKNGRVWAICVPYVTNRAIQTRLDEVVGPGNWKNEFKPGPGGGVMCGLSVRVGAEWVTKWDGAENTDIEGVKGGLSGAMKRAAVQWGIGRYLYALDESFATVHENGRFRGKTKQGSDFRWDPPALPAWALPEKAAPPAPPERPTASKAKAKADSKAAAPATAAALSREAPPAEEHAVSPDEHEAMLLFVRQVGPQVDDGAKIKVDRELRNLKDFVRENWPTIKEQPEIAWTVVSAIEEATGTPFAAARTAA